MFFRRRIKLGWRWWWRLTVANRPWRAWKIHFLVPMFINGHHRPHPSIPNFPPSVRKCRSLRKNLFCQWCLGAIPRIAGKQKVTKSRPVWTITLVFTFLILLRFLFFLPLKNVCCKCGPGVGRFGNLFGGDCFHEVHRRSQFHGPWQSGPDGRYDEDIHFRFNLYGGELRISHRHHHCPGEASGRSCGRHIRIGPDYPVWFPGILSPQPRSAAPGGCRETRKSGSGGINLPPASRATTWSLPSGPIRWINCVRCELLLLSTQKGVWAEKKQKERSEVNHFWEWLGSLI